MAYCSQCGTKLKEGSKFCTECGAVVPQRKKNLANTETGVKLEEPVSNGMDPDIDKSVSAEADANGEEYAQAEEAVSAETDASVEESAPAEQEISAQAEENATPEKAEREESLLAPAEAKAKTAKFGGLFREIRVAGRFSISLFALVIAIIIASAGVAYAAYRVVTEVIIPAIEQAQEQTQESDNQGESTAQTGDSTEQTAEATGNPQNVLQVAEILAMKPEDILAYLESEGGVYHPASSYEDSSILNHWAFDDANVESTLGSDFYIEGSSVSYTEEASFVLTLGTNFESPSWGGMYGFQTNKYGSEQDSSDESLAAGEAPTDITLMTTNIAALTDDTISEFLKLCNLPTENYQKFVIDSSYEGAPDNPSYSGACIINGQKYYWVIYQGVNENYVDSNGNARTWVSTYFSCLSESSAKNIVDYELAHGNEWDSASDADRCAWLSESYLEAMTFGNGGGRTNLYTGEYEYYDEETGTWIPASEGGMWRPSE